MPLSNGTIARRITDMAQDIKCQLVDSVNNPIYVIVNIVEVAFCYFIVNIFARFKVRQSHFRLCITWFYFERVPVATRTSCNFTTKEFYVLATLGRGTTFLRCLTVSVWCYGGKRKVQINQKTSVKSRPSFGGSATDSVKKGKYALQLDESTDILKLCPAACFHQIQFWRKT